MPGLIDHIVAGLVVVVWPLYVARNGRKELQELKEDPSQRLGTYRRTMLFQWAHAVVVLAVWLVVGRPLADIGIAWGEPWGMAAATVLAISLLLVGEKQRAGIHDDVEKRDRMREQLGEMEGFLPKSRQEVTAFRQLAVTAGVCEEFVYRGFLLWYLAAFMPMPFAVLVMIACFGGVHLYQGVAAALQIAVIGLLAACLYLLSGSLLVPIVLHALFDLQQLALVRTIGRHEAQPAA